MAEEKEAEVRACVQATVTEYSKTNEYWLGTICVDEFQTV